MNEYMLYGPEFKDCLSEVSDVLDEYSIESVFMLGDCK